VTGAADVDFGMGSCSMRLFVLLSLLASSAAFAQTPAAPVTFPGGPATTLGAQVIAITSAPAAARAHWGIAVTALDGTPIYGLNEGEFFRPASNAKLFTTAAAMHLVGPEMTVSTTARIASPVQSNGTVKGDIVLVGAGDANISGRQFPYLSPAERKRQAAASSAPAVAPDPLRYIDEMAASVAHKGVKRITGNVVGDDTLWPWEPYANDWSIDDAVWGYGAPVSALTINDNQLDLTIVPALAVGRAATAKLDPETGYYTLQVKVQTVAAGEPASIRIDRAIGSRTVRIVGTVALGKPYSTEIAIEDPAEFAAQAFKAALISHGVKVDGKAVALHRESSDTEGFSDESHEPLPTLPGTAVSTRPFVVCPDDCAIAARHNSPTLAEDIKLTLKISQNLHAEMLLHRLGKMYGSEGSAAQGARVVRQFLLNAGLDGDDFVFYDGSGLSGHDLVTPRGTVKLLSYAAHSQTPGPMVAALSSTDRSALLPTSWFEQWKASLPVGGEDGTLAGRFSKPPLKDHLFAKTGTLSEARALSGYVDCASGKTVIFSVMVDNHAPNTPADREAMDSIVAAIAANN
jgi:D-alanyl-D-alanine carboxypeptidase/D-alanyl-D-alanine-endopeptidase (penicillin-binding protein 4)